MREIPELSIRGGELRRQYSNGTDSQWTLSLLTATLRLPLPVTAMRQVSQSWPTSETPFFFFPLSCLIGSPFRTWQSYTRVSALYKDSRVWAWPIAVVCHWSCILSQLSLIWFSFQFSPLSCTFSSLCHSLCLQLSIRSRSDLCSIIINVPYYTNPHSKIL